MYHIKANKTQNISRKERVELVEQSIKGEIRVSTPHYPIITRSSPLSFPLLHKETNLILENCENETKFRFDFNFVGGGRVFRFTVV